jgi:hypothetical protein
MRELQIFILDVNGNQLGELDLTDSDDFALKLTKSLASINDLGRRNTSFSLDFDAPQSKNNNKLLAGLRFATHSKEILGYKPCSIMVDGNQIDRGFLYPFESEFDGMYKLNFKGLNNDWVERLRDVELNELNWRDYVTGLRDVDATEWFDANRINTILNVNNSDNYDLVYPLVNRNNNGTSQNKRPQLHLKSIVDSMFEKIGYTVNSNFFNSDWIKGVVAYVDAFGNNYNHLGLSVDPSFQMMRDQQDLIGQSIEYTSSGITGTDPNTEWADDTEMGNLATPPATNFRTVYRFPTHINNLITDTFARFDPLTSEFTVGTTGKYTVEFDFEFEFAFWNLTFTTWQKYTGLSTYYEHPPSFKWYIVKNNSASNTVIDGQILFQRSIINVGAPNTAQVRPQGNIQYSTLDHDFVAGDKISIFLELEENSKGHVLGWLNTQPPLTLANPGAMIYWKLRILNGAVLKIAPKADVQLGDVFRINSHIPEGIKCLSLLQDFKTMFNLYFDVDVNRKIVTIEPRDDFYTGVTEDITDMVDLSTPPVLNYLTSYKNEIVFEYVKDSKDKYLEQWNKVNKITYAQYKYLLQNNERFEKGQSTLSTALISASIQEQLENPANYPQITSIIKEEYLASDNVGKGVNQNYGARVFQLVSGTQYTPANVLRRNSVDLVAIMEDYANTPTFEDRKLTFVGTKGLVEDYYTKTLANIEDTAVLSIKINLSLYDYLKWDLKKSYYISEPAEIAGYYITDSIKNFNVTKEEMTSITLVKFKDFEPVAVQQGTGNVNAIIPTTPQPQEIMVTVNGAIVSCLDNNTQKMYKL